MEKLPLVDSHVHLDDSRVAAAVDAGALSALRAMGWRGAVIAGYGPDRDGARPAPLRDTPDVIFAHGWHPWWLAAAVADGVDLERAWRTFEDCIRTTGCAVGEIGLDRGRRGLVDLAEQQRWFLRALQLARAHDRPVIIHAVGWHGHLLDTLRGPIGSDLAPPWRGVVHRFGGSAEVAAALVATGLHISLAADALSWDADRLAALVGAAGERLLFETDHDGAGGGYLDAFGALQVLVQRVAVVLSRAPSDLAAEHNRRVAALFGDQRGFGAERGFGDQRGVT